MIVKVPITESDTTINYCLRLSDGSMVDNIKDLVIWNSGGICPAAWISQSLKVSFRVSFSTRRGVFFVTASLPRAFARNFILSSDMIGYGQRVEKVGMPNGHHIEIRPLKWVLIRTIPEVAAELRDDRRVLFLGRARR